MRLSRALFLKVKKRQSLDHNFQFVEGNPFWNYEGCLVTILELLRILSYDGLLIENLIVVQDVEL